MVLFSGALCLAAILGYLAQTTGLCMVRGVNEWLAGKPVFLLAILLSGVWAWTAVVGSYYLEVALPFRAFQANGWIALGGLLFGLGTALNQGCGVSTLSQLSRGYLPMIATLTGWVAGWCGLARWRLEVVPVELAPPTVLTYAALAALSLSISVWALRGDRQRKQLWLGMMGIGFVAGLLFLYEPRWPPSGFLQDLSAALLHGENSRRPAPPRLYLLLALLGGMILAALSGRRFTLKFERWSVWVRHLLAGTLMGLGASLAMGGNDSQLLLALPALSPAGFLAVVGILAGIVTGLKVDGAMRRRIHGTR